MTCLWLFFEMEVFLWHHFLWDIFTLFITTTFSLYVETFTFNKFSGCTSGISNCSSTNIPSQLFLLQINLCLIQILLPAFFTSFLWCSFIFLGQISFSIMHFYKNIYLWIFYWETGQQHKYRFCSLHELTSRCAEINHQQTLKEAMWFDHGLQWVSVIYAVICGLRAKSCLYFLQSLAVYVLWSQKFQLCC